MQMTFNFTSPPPQRVESDSNDYHLVRPSDKQRRFAQQIAARLGVPVPTAALADRQALSAWIDAHKDAAPSKPSRFANYPSSKQVAFAERIARIKRRAVPNECFKDRKMMSRWIDSNL